jgi:hypothetical protein
MSRTQSILDRIARLTRSVRLKRHITAIADAVKALSASDAVQLRALLDNAAESAAATPDAAPNPNAAVDSLSAEPVFEALNELSVDRQLRSDSAIVRVRYIAKWLNQAIRLTVGHADPQLREIHRNAVAIVRGIQVVPGVARKESWFITKDKRVS